MIGQRTKENLLTALWYTVVTTILLGVIYPLVITAIAQAFFKDKAGGQLIRKNGTVIGSRLLAQPFTGPEYFHPRPSSAGANGYDAANSGATNLGPTNRRLVERVAADVARLQSEHPNERVPIDLVTTSASGLDSDITPAAAEFQMPRVARARGIGETELRRLVLRYTKPRQFGFLGEPRVNVLELNLALDENYPIRQGEAHGIEFKP